MTGLARSTVGARVDALLAAGLLTPSGEAASTGGRPPARLAFNPDAGVVIGADLGATHALVALTDLRGRVVAEKALRHRHLRRPRAGARPGRPHRHAPCCRTPAADRSDLAGVGIGLPGPVEHSTGRPVLPPIMPGWDNYDVPGHIEQALGGPVLVDNDVNLMALGEHATVYPDVEQMIFVKVATGIGAGIISGGRLHRGAQGAAGDLGHVAALNGGDTPVHLRQRRLPRGRRERPGRRAGAARAGESTPATAATWCGWPSRATSRPRPRSARRAARSGTSSRPASACSTPRSSPSAGSLAQSAESLLAGIREVVYGRSLPLATGELQIVASRTGGHAGVIGAATMVVQHVLSAEQVEHQLSRAAAV